MLRGVPRRSLLPDGGIDLKEAVSGYSHSGIAKGDEICGSSKTAEVSIAMRIHMSPCGKALGFRPRDSVIALGEARAWTPALQPAGRPALQSCRYQIMRSQYHEKSAEF